MKNKTLYFFYIIIILLPLYGCLKLNKERPCKEVTINYDAPDSLKAWFSEIMDSNVNKINFQSKSNTGLSESIIIYKDNMHYSISDCFQKYYWVGYYDYYPNLYKKNRFAISIGNRYDYYPTENNPTGNGTTYPDIYDFKIHYSFSVDPNELGYIVDLIQPISPNYSTQIKAAYYTRSEIPTVTKFIYCDTCYEFVGRYMQNNRTYTEVSKYKSPITIGLSNSLKELLIDKKYGIIKIIYKDNTTWNVDPF